MIYAKISTTNVYHRPLTINELDAVKDALTDWRADGIMEDDDEFELRIKKWAEQNRYIHNVDTNAVFYNPESELYYTWNDNHNKTWWTEGIFLKSDDTCIGFTRGKFVDRYYRHHVTAFRPAYRKQGYYAESDLLGCRSIFEIKGIEKEVVMIPTEYLNTNGSIISASTLLGDDEDDVTLTDRIDPVTYRTRTITKEAFLAWFNDPAQEAVRNTPFEIELIHENLF